MKNIKRFFMIIASALLLFAGCAKVESPYNNQIPVNSKGEYAITFTKMPTTKASVAAWSTFGGYDKFQLFTWNADEAIMNPFKVEGEGNEYKYDGVGNQTLQYFKKQYDAYNFIGIIPDNASASLNDTTVTVTGVESFVVDDKRVETDIVADSPKEFLYAQAAVEKANYGHNVTLPFKHGNALLKLSFKSDKSDTELLDYVPERTTPGTTTPNKQESKLAGTAWASTSTAVGVVITQDDIDYINGLFTYNSGLTFTYGDGADILSTQGYITGYFQEALGIKDYLISKHPSLASVSDNFMNRFANFYLIHIEKNGNEVCGWFYNKTKGGTSSVSTYTETTTPGATIPAIEGIRVFSADSTSTGYAHVAHTLNTKAVVTPVTFAWEDRVAATDSIQFSLPATTVLASEQWSPTTFYAIPGDTDLNYFVVKFSYKYDGTTVYDVRVPLKLPAGGFVAGKYYHYIINITSTGNGTNDPGEAEGDKDVIDIVDNPIVVTVTTTDYTKGHEVTVTI